MSFVFFFSYAHANLIQDQKLETFFADLSTEVRQLMGPGEQEPSFLDRESMRVGAEWTPALAEALQTSSVLVCLVSADYLSSSFCGKELQIFLDRRERHGNSPSVILPIIWTKTPTRPLPQVITQFQYSDARLPERYASKGLRSLMMANDQAGYQMFIEALAESIVTAAGLNPPLTRLPETPGFDQVKNPFALESSPSAPNAANAPADFSIPSTARIVYVAAPDREMAAAEIEENAVRKRLRNDITRYGRTGYFWQPYGPLLNRPIGEITFDSVRGYEYKSADLGPDVVEQLLRADATGEVVVLIVDPWTLRFDPYQSLMQEFDRRAPINSAVVIPWNAQDEESRESEKALSATVRLTFQRFFENSNRFRFPVRTPEEFTDAIRQILSYISLNASDLQAARVLLKGPGLPTVSTAAGVLRS
jgi:FxsC-like protein